VLGGLGQYGIIVKAQLKLAPVAPVVQVYMLTYSHYSEFIAAQRKALEIGLFDYMEGQVLLNQGNGQWEYMIEGFQQQSPFKTNQDVFANLPNPSRQQLMMMPYLAFMARVSIFEFEWRRAGVWKTPHPWFDVFVPDSCIDDTVEDILINLSPADVGPGVILLFPFYRKNLHSPMVSVPNSDIVWLFDILRFSPDNPEVAANMVNQNRTFFDLLAQKGAKRYPISAIHFEENDWKTHYGEKWEEVKSLKQKYDPNFILTPNQRVFG
jgi:FAD/FMN-containing dehydrogenase